MPFMMLYHAFFFPLFSIPIYLAKICFIETTHACTKCNLFE